MRHILPLLFAGLALMLTGQTCVHRTAKQFDPVQVNFQATYNPDYENILYPSLVLGLASYHGDVKHHLFSYSVTSPKDHAVLRVVVDSSVLNYVTIEQEILDKKGVTYTFYPMLKWKYENLYGLRQQGMVDITFTCFINDEEVDVKNIRLNYRSVNECLLSLLDSEGKYVDYRWLFATYVNEDHPYINDIMSGALEQGTISSFTGYQKGEESVTKQVYALWHYVQKRGINYSSISCTSNPSKKSNSQHIRFFDEVYKSKQANCIDACVFFASIMRKIGLKPVIFVEPCHAYLGYYKDKNRKKLALLETTITGWADLPSLERSVAPRTGRASDAAVAKVRKYVSDDEMERYKAGKMTLDELEHCITKTLFLKASEYNIEQYKNNQRFFADSNSFTYQQLDIESLRKVVQPIHRDE